jgi:hypothetical protein
VQLGAKKEAYTLVLDASTGGDRGHDILYLDADRDGRITAEEKLTGLNRDQGYVFGPVKIMVDCGNEKCPQWFLFQLSEYEYAEGTQVQRNLQAVNAGYYQGTVTFGDKKCLVAFVDADADGLYNNYLKTDHQSDRLLFDSNNDGKLDGNWQSEETAPLGRHLQVGDRYWRIDLAADGATVAVEPLDQPLGTLRTDIADFTLLLRGEEGVLRVRGTDGTARLPAGKYRLHQCNYKVMQDGKAWKFRARAGAKMPEIVVPPDGDAKIAFGAPLTPKIHAAPQGDNVTLSLELRGAGGEIYDDVQIGDNYQRPPVPKAKLLDANGKELALVDFHYG